MRALLLSLLVACGRPPEDSAPDPGSDTADTAAPETPRAALQLRLPLVEPDRFPQVIGVDHDPAEYSGIDQLRCEDYLGRAFPHCYDGHEGSDLILQGGFEAMDAGSTPVVAAYDGEVVYAEDGHYDRCHGSLETGSVDCDGHDGKANAVILSHTDPTGVVWRTLYWHLKEGSVLVAVGDPVEAGQALGLVGSSGFSTVPHLHFGLEDATEATVDPYAGPSSQPETFWCAQGEVDGLPGLCD